MFENPVAFWIVLAALTALVATVLVLPALRATRSRGAAQPGASDIGVYKDQLAEVERDIARGTLSPEDGARVRLEVSRRLLAADARASDPERGAPQNTALRLFSVGLSVLVLAGAVVLYARMGVPLYPDQPLQDRLAAAKEARDSRPSQAEAEADMPPRPALSAPDPEYAALIDKLRQAVSERPDDAQGQALLARNEAVLGNYAEAYRAQGRYIALTGDAAVAQDHLDHADMMILAAGGYVSPEAEAALRAALDLDATNGAARYYLGLMMAQTGRPDVTFRMWDALLRDSRADDPWVAPVRAQIGLAAQRAGVDYTLPDLPGDESTAPALPGPDSDAISAAEEMAPEDRDAMVRGMVDRLSDRLATEGGAPQEWARLIRALGVLGESDRARAIWQESLQVFAGQAEAIAELRAAAESAGVAE